MTHTRTVITWKVGDLARVVRSWSAGFEGRVVQIVNHPLRGTGWALNSGYWVTNVDPPWFSYEAMELAPLTPEELVSTQLKVQSHL